MVTLTNIAKKAFDAVAGKIPGVIKPVSFSRVVYTDTYDPTTGEYVKSTQTTTGRAVAESEIAVEDAFPDLIASTAGSIWFVAETDFPPKENDSFVVNGSTQRVKAVRDIMENGELFRVLVN